MSITLPEFGDAVIRVDKGTNYASLKDLLLVFGYNETNISKVINGLPDELKEKCTLMQLNGVGQKMLCAPANILIEIVWALKSSKTDEFRSQCAKTICRVLGGDLSLAEEIEKRHSTISTIEEEFFFSTCTTTKRVRQELIVCGEVLGVIEPWMDKKTRDNVIRLYNKRICEEIDISSQKSARIHEDMLATADRLGLHPNQKSLIRDMAANNLTGGGGSDVLKLTNEPEYCSEFTKMFTDMGCSPTRSMMVKAGQKVSKEYQRRYGKVPEKRLKYVNGEERMVCVYPIEDEDWIKNILKELME